MIDPASNTSLDRPATILTVCTGNICRSVYAERILAMYFHPDEVMVHSAGTMAVQGADMTDETRELIPDDPHHTRTHVARQLTAELVDSADVILTATKEHRSDVVRLLPRAVRKVFTLREAARMIMMAPELPDPPTPHDAVLGLAGLLSAARSHHPGQYLDDVADPYRKGREAFEAMKGEMDPALAVVVRYCIGRLDRG